ncbi:MAG: CBS domain-containing protein, partial [PS1 clade bacterium]|nr:CBS domain-containing protein [PS1 clade bacterium]
KLGASLSRIREVMHAGDALPLADGAMRMDEAIVVMTEKGFGCLGIVDGKGALSGIITDGDLRRHMADDLLAKTTSDIMTANPLTIGGDKLTAEALNLMQENKIQCLFVCEEGKPTGLVRVLDLLRLGTA